MILATLPTKYQIQFPKHQLAMADAIVYATALKHEAQLITRDRHFKFASD